jgi:hypothetical protein
MLYPHRKAPAKLFRNKGFFHCGTFPRWSVFLYYLRRGAFWRRSKAMNVCIYAFGCMNWFGNSPSLIKHTKCKFAPISALYKLQLYAYTYWSTLANPLTKFHRRHQFHAHMNVRRLRSKLGIPKSKINIRTPRHEPDCSYITPSYDLPLRPSTCNTMYVIIIRFTINRYIFHPGSV